MLKKILSYGFVEGLAKGLNKLTLLVLPFFLDTASYGKIGLLVAIEMIVPLISLLGFERAVLRFYANKEEFNNFNKTIFYSVKWSHLLLLLIPAAIYFSGHKDFFGLNVFPDLFLMVALIYFQGTNLITLNMLRVNEDHKKYFQGRLFIQVCRLFSIILFIYLTKSYLGYLIGGILAAILSNFIYTVKKGKEFRTERFNKATFISLFTFSWPFIFHGVAGNLLGNADKFILQKFMSLNEVGLYTFAYSLGSTIVFAYVGISVFMEPLIYKENDPDKRKLLLTKYLFMTICFGAFAYLLIALASKYLLVHIYNAKFFPVFEYIPMIALSYLIYPFYLKSNYKMIYEKKSLNIATVSVFSSIVNIALNIYFIPIYGIYAAVFTTLISYIIQASLFVLMSNKFRFDEDFTEVFIMSAIVTFGVCFQLEYYYMLMLISLYLGYIYVFKLKNKAA